MKEIIYIFIGVTVSIIIQINYGYLIIIFINNIKITLGGWFIMKELSKKGFQVGDILPLALVIVVAGVGIGFGLQVLGDVQADMTALSAEANATGDTITAVAKFSSKLGIIVTVIVAAILIGILVRYLMRPGQ